MKYNNTASIQSIINSISIDFFGNQKTAPAFDPYTDSSYTELADTVLHNLIFYVYDHLGNTRVTYQPIVNPLDSTIDYYIKGVFDYYPYGKILRQYQAENEKYLTTQHQRDIETGFDYRGARFYDSDVARFLSVDPLAVKFSNHSSYFYVAGNPILLIDPNGKEWTTAVDKAGNVTYTGEEGDSYETFIKQYSVTEEEAKELFIKSGLEAFTVKSEKKDKTILGFKYDEEAVYKTFDKETAECVNLNTTKMFRISGGSSDQAKTNHLMSVLKYSQAKGENMLDLKDYFGIGGGSDEMRDVFIKIESKKIPIRYISMLSTGKSRNVPSETKTNPANTIYIINYSQIGSTNNYQSIQISINRNSENEELLYKFLKK